jgi:hypothetical protein
MAVTLLNIRDAVDRKLGNYVMAASSTDSGDGESTVFDLSHSNIIGSTFFVSVDAAIAPSAVCGGVLDDTAGTYTFTLIPIAEAEIIFSYQYKHWSDDQVLDAINGGIGELFGRFYSEGESTITSTGAQEYDVYDNATPTPAALTFEDRITRLEYWSDPHWVRINGWSIRNSGGVKSIHFESAPASGYTMRVSYVKQPSAFTTDAETLTDLGLSDRVKEPLVLYACSELIASRIGPRIRDDRAHNTQNENAIKSYEMVNDAQYFRALAELKASKIRQPAWVPRIRY